MVAGGTIIMPSAISTLATTRSMIRKGIKMVKPIWKAVFNSLVTKAGSSTRNGRSSGPAMGPTSASRANRAMSGSRVCASMNSRNGWAPRSTNSGNSICSCSSGTQAWS